MNIYITLSLFSDGGQFNWDVIASAVPSKDVNQVFHIETRKLFLHSGM